MNTIKKKILYAAPDHYGFYKVILKGLQNFTNYEVTFFKLNKEIPQYKYKGEKVLNFFTKNFFFYNTKKRRHAREYINRIKALEKYDILFINRPDIFTNKELTLISSKCSKTIVYYWDSFDKIKGQKETLSYFDVKYSFDKKDCKNHQLQKGHNFYFHTESLGIPEFDVFFLGTYDNRYPELTRILDILKNNGLKAQAKLFFAPDDEDIKIFRSDISVLEEIIPFDKAYKFNLNTRIILDIQHKNQVGLSFRPFEAMGLRKKLITNNAHIKEHDFYNPNNIFVITESTYDIPNAFLTTPYVDVAPKILEKYSLKSWINKFIS